MAEGALVTVRVTLERGSPPHSATASKTIKLASAATADVTVQLPVVLNGCSGGPGGPEQATVDVDVLNEVQESNEANNEGQYTLG